MPDDVVTRGEFDLLRSIVAGNQAHLDRVNAIGIVQTQLTEVVKDLAELKAEVDKRFDGHNRQHEQDRQARTTARRWAVSTSLAALAIIVTLLLNITLHLR